MTHIQRARDASTDVQLHAEGAKTRNDARHAADIIVKDSFLCLFVFEHIISSHL